MDEFVGRKRNWIATVLCAVFIATAGCKREKSDSVAQSETNGNLPATLPHDKAPAGLDGNAIIRQLLGRYSSAQTYRDNGVLYLSYRLKGQYIEEPQRWETKWDRDGNRISVNVFNSKIHADGRLMSCFVFDIDTANLDNQHRLTAYGSELPLDQLYRDSIAKHFLGGYSELPLDETDFLSTPKLIPAPVSLLTNQVPSDWLHNPSRVQRLADQTVDENLCYVVRTLSNDMTADIWIAQETGTLVQMSLPLKLLAGEVISTPDEITDVVLLARFHDAKLNEPVAEDLFAIPDRPDSTPVKKFVALPETFPSEMIGNEAPDFRLRASTGEDHTKIHFDGKVTALLWVAGHASYTALEQFGQIAEQIASDQFSFATVYSDSELNQPDSENLEPNADFSKAARSSGLPIYYDRDLKASSALGVKVIPSVIVLDGDSRIHFSRALSNESWATDLKAAMERVAAGDDVASEMQSEYTQFIESYQQQLETVSAADLVEVSNASSVNRDAIQSRLRPQKIWSNSDFKKPGNLAILNSPDPDGATALVYDGWQTIVALSPGGKTIARHELKLPTEEGTTQIRIGPSNGRQRYALFGRLGKQVVWFDQSWNFIGAYPSEDVSHAGITDCQLVDLNSDGETKLIVSFQDENGIHVVDPESGNGSRISRLHTESVAAMDRGLVICTGGKIGLLKTGLVNSEASELAFHRIVSTGNGQLCGLGKRSNGQWNAIGLDNSLSRKWALAIGPQLFETAIEPIAATLKSDNRVVWAVADTANAIHLISGSGKWLGEFSTGKELTGMGLATLNGKTCLITASSSGVECWQLNLPPNPVPAANVSHRKQAGKNSPRPSAK